MPGPLESARAVIFDLDGTLVDSLDDIAWHLNAALADAGLPVRSLDDIRAWVGTGAAQLVAHAVPSPDHAADVLARFRVHYRSAPYDRTRVFAGLAGVLDQLAAAGRVLAVLSNKPDDLVVRITAHLLGRWAFAAVVGERADRPKKPHPDALRLVVGDLGVPAERCVLVGDSEIDIATARAAGIPVVAVTWGLREPTALAAARPDHLVSTPAELVGLFGV